MIKKNIPMVKQPKKKAEVKEIILRVCQEFEKIPKDKVCKNCVVLIRRSIYLSPTIYLKDLRSLYNGSCDNSNDFYNSARIIDLGNPHKIFFKQSYVYYVGS